MNADLDRLLDSLVDDLPDLSPPPDLNALILEQISITPQDHVVPSVEAPHVAEQELELPAAANPTGRRWAWFAGPAMLAAAALLATVWVGPSLFNMNDGIGDPADWTARGTEGAGPGVDLMMAVQTPNGTDRFSRGASYEAGDTLMFRVDAHAAGTVYLVRVDSDGTELLHEQSVGTGAADLQTGGQVVGYELESGEPAAVFAVIRTDIPIEPRALVEGLSVPVDVGSVCAAAHTLGGRCSAERVEAVQ
ncbi:MAG: hypothetical protein AB8H79_20920 [Myxococcota bacterium]